MMAVVTRRAKGRQRRIPQRRCVACGQTTAKRELVRIVATPAGPVAVDLTGKKAGRGAYLCRREECWRGGLKKNRLDYALRCTLSQEDREHLMAYMASQLAAWAAAQSAATLSPLEALDEP